MVVVVCVIDWQETSCYFRYCIRIESARDDEVTLRTRKWHILSHKSGEALPVSGRAVIGLVSSAAVCSRSVIGLVSGVVVSQSFSDQTGE